jgi:hypothetical protein
MVGKTPFKLTRGNNLAYREKDSEPEEKKKVGRRAEGDRHRFGKSKLSVMAAFASQPLSTEGLRSFRELMNPFQ